MMKLTTKRLKQLIREELSRMNENAIPPYVEKLYRNIERFLISTERLAYNGLPLGDHAGLSQHDVGNGKYEISFGGHTIVKVEAREGSEKPTKLPRWASGTEEMQAFVNKLDMN